MKPRNARVVVVLLTLIVAILTNGASVWARSPAWPSASQGADVAATEPFGPDDLVPVILVHGLGGSAASTWGAPADQADSPSGMYLALCRAGYVPGRTLFTCDYHSDNLGDYREVGQRFLPAVIDQARAASGASRVDLISRSMGGLVARSYVSSASYRGDVRTLVMIATPNRGSFAANIVKAMEMIQLQEQLRDRGSLHRRPLAKAALPAPGELFGQFTDEVEYVRSQSQQLWEPLFAEYYCSAWLLGNRSTGRPSGPPDFLSWLKTNHTWVYQAVVSTQRPPVDPSYVGSGGFTGGIPGDGQSLTRAYYEAVSLQCARHNFFLAFGGQPAEALPPAQPKGLLERLVGWVEGAVATLFGRLVRDHGQGLLVWALEHLTGLDPKARAAECLVEEQFKLSLGGPVSLPTGSSGQAYAMAGAAALTEPDLRGNYYLAAWNDADAASRRSSQVFGAALGRWPPTVRYISIAGQVTNLWSRLWPDIGPNDLVVETDSAFLPLCENDAYHLMPSLVATNHVWIGGAGKALDALLTSLRNYYPVEASFAPKFNPAGSPIKEYSKAGMIRAEVHTPSYVEFKLPQAYGAAVISLAAEGAVADGAGLAAWAYLEVPGAGLRRYPLSFITGQGGATTASATIPAPGVPGARVLVGVRGCAPANGSSPPADTQTKIAWRLAYLPEELANSLGILATGPADTGAARQPTADQSPTGTSAAIPPNLVALPPAAIPVIRATHRDKQTMTLEPSVTQHVRWQWDFGDGTTLIDDQVRNVDCTVAHDYSQPGRYVCRARSFGEDGSALADYQWLAEVQGDGGGQRTFAASTVPWADVELELVGPLAWVTGLPAEYQVKYRLRLPPGTPAEDYTVRVEPAEQFEMIWEKPGEFTVKAALVLRLRYDAGQGRASVVNVYTVEKLVRVHATVVTD